ncbi:Hsp70 protein, partial [Gilliamella apicola SCGC AB-598-B02]
TVNSSQQPKKESNTVNNQNKESAVKKKVKLSYNEQRELAQLPSKIEQLEIAIADLQAQIGQSDFFNQPHDITGPILQSLSDKEAELEAVFDRWEQLEALSQQ